MRRYCIAAIGFLYRGIIKPIFFRIDPVVVHERVTRLGERLGAIAPVRNILARLFGKTDTCLSQAVFGLNFKSPVGLAAGFDYEAKLTRILPALGFGFGTLGTVTYAPSNGNPGRTLGRLPRSKSLMVNKGFKNLGIFATLEKLKRSAPEYPAGLSIGQTNISHPSAQSAVEDIAAAFRAAEKSGSGFGYYELNISCPNLASAVNFYEINRLEMLLKALDDLSLSRPVFIKMPISETEEVILGILSTASRYTCISGIILGNLQKDRKHPQLLPEEVDRFPVGNFSGAPCRQRSDILIALAYKHYAERFIIIGCGGIFSAEDAYRKIRLGASLVQLITGMVFEGPQLAASINSRLPEFLARDGYESITEAVGSLTKGAYKR